MSGAKFTKGEWVKTGQFTVQIGVSGPYTELSTQGTGGVYSCVTEREANAHLIKVSPKMYRLLEEIMLHSSHTGGEDWYCDDINELLKEARGEQLWD